MAVSLIILAAGLSVRMGVFKPLLPVGSEITVMRLVRVAAAAHLREVIVVTGHLCEELADAVESSGCKLSHNADYRDGMFSSVCAGVRALSGDTDGFFLLPADCAAVSPDDLGLLIGEFYKHGKSHVIRPRYGNRRGHPPLIPMSFANDLLSYDGADGLKGFLRDLPTFEVVMDSPAVLLDMDTPKDYADLLSHLGLSAYPDNAECLALLKKHGASEEIIEHGRNVAAVALSLADDHCLLDIDRELLRTACLLHDIKRAEPDHASRGMEILLQEGYPEAAILVGSHMDMTHDITDVSEAELLYLADKLCRRSRVVPLDDTLRELSVKFASDPVALSHARRRIEDAQKIQDLLRSVNEKTFY